MTCVILMLRTFAFCAVTPWVTLVFLSLAIHLLRTFFYYVRCVWSRNSLTHSFSTKNKTPCQRCRANYLISCLFFERTLKTLIERRSIPIIWQTPNLKFPPDHRPKKNIHTLIHPGFCVLLSQKQTVKVDSWKRIKIYFFRAKTNKKNKAKSQRISNSEPDVYSITLCFEFVKSSN